MDEPVIMLSLEKDMHQAFQQFTNYPTQSGRVKLRQKLLSIAGALEVEAYNLPSDEAAILSGAIENLKVLAETALVAPKEVLVKGYAPEAPQKAQPVFSTPRKRFANSLFRDALRMFRFKK